MSEDIERHCWESQREGTDLLSHLSRWENVEWITRFPIILISYPNPDPW